MDVIADVLSDLFGFADKRTVEFACKSCNNCVEACADVGFIVVG